MTPFNIAFLFCRLLSIWCVARFAELFAQVAAQIFIVSTTQSSFAAKTPWSNLLVHAVWPLGLIFVAFVLWVAAPLIARMAATNIEYSNGASEHLASERDNLRKFMSVGKTLLGLYFVIAGASALAEATIGVLTEKASPEAAVFGAIYKGSLIASIFNLILGALLIFLARRALKREVDSQLFTSSQDANQTGSL